MVHSGSKVSNIATLMRILFMYNTFAGITTFMRGKCSTICMYLIRHIMYSIDPLNRKVNEKVTINRIMRPAPIP